MQQDNTFNPLKVAFISSSFYWVIDMIMYPLETLGNRLKANKNEYVSLSQEIKRHYQQKQLGTLYKGFHMTFPCAFVPCFIFMYIYENFNHKSKQYLNSYYKNNKLNYILPFLSVPISDILPLMFYSPCDLVRTRMQVEISNNKGIVEMFKDIYQKEGLIRFYKAAPVFIAYTMSNTTVGLALYEIGRSEILIRSPYYEINVFNDNKKRMSENRLGNIESVLLSLFVSFSTSIICNPLDVLLTRMQIENSQKHKLKIRIVVQEILQKEGWKGLYKGVSARIFYSSIFAVVFFPSFESLKSKYGVSLHNQLTKQNEVYCFRMKIDSNNSSFKSLQM